MRVTYDPRKRAETLEQRGLDFEDAVWVFAERLLERKDDRYDYGEVRWQTSGLLRGRLVMVVWTPRGDARHVISMRKCNDRETRRILGRLDRPR